MAEAHVAITPHNLTAPRSAVDGKASSYRRLHPGWRMQPDDAGRRWSTYRPTSGSQIGIEKSPSASYWPRLLSLSAKLALRIVGAASLAFELRGDTPLEREGSGGGKGQDSRSKDLALDPDLRWESKISGYGSISLPKVLGGATVDENGDYLFIDTESGLPIMGNVSDGVNFTTSYHRHTQDSVKSSQSESNVKLTAPPQSALAQSGGLPVEFSQAQGVSPDDFDEDTKRSLRSLGLPTDGRLLNLLRLQDSSHNGHSRSQLFDLRTPEHVPYVVRQDNWSFGTTEDIEHLNRHMASVRQALAHLNESGIETRSHVIPGVTLNRYAQPVFVCLIAAQEIRGPNMLSVRTQPEEVKKTLLSVINYVKTQAKAGQPILADIWSPAQYVGGVMIDLDQRIMGPALWRDVLKIGEDQIANLPSRVLSTQDRLEVMNALNNARLDLSNL